MYTRIEDKFWPKVEVLGLDECWNWVGPLTDTGRGRFSPGRRYGVSSSSSRVAWTLTHSMSPEGLCVCHKCDNPRCCNPTHLFLGTQSQNLEDMRIKGRSNTGKSHKLTAEDVQRILESTSTRSELSRELSVSKNTISLVRSGKSRLKLQQAIYKQRPLP